MIFEEVIGNINDIENLSDFHIEVIYLDSDNLSKRILRVISDHDNEYGISLGDKDTSLSNGDILFNDGKNLIVIKTNSEDVIVIRPNDINEMGVVAHLLGNTHVPVQIKDGKIILQYDYVIEKMLKDMNIKYSLENISLEKAMKHVNYAHKH
ncbi:urease accessory protein UreE (plasmid) [Clostridium perfringens]|uniref:Urease accessory protein UreE n=3 Tax=Clostridium perfringens TaxID=1502 RepID=A0AAP7BX15_CLOPF|nr:urease accessory protein UreE [Clostridium perfringens]EDT14775.1 urease accessory protein UreE [Clostridium perfringens E str. JGS1987]EDT23110.1 urease accessory protein UreE [Clostridium perfringens B str. ATCC 3626]ELC8333203.1 urease accessory protein UreE [Clostridium perfringens]ELC8463937.1 urease accessory protein UreE [Clostridium perfringens]MDT7988879.1 urease accessory protein UreE [Clostridium perfringens]